MMHVLFFATYMVSNAMAILSLPVDSKLDPIIVSNRKSKAKTIIAVIVGMTALVSILRYTTKTETPAGILVAVLAAWGLGYGWYELAAICGARAADVFGVMQQILPSSATADKPMTCVYAPKP
jgi:hypothetical protein